MDKTEAGGRCVSQHKAFAYGYIIINRRGDTVHSSTYKGVDAANPFIESLSAKWADTAKTMPNEQNAHNNEKMCEMCHQKFLRQQQKHRHHDHTKQHHDYIGAYCAWCSIEMKNHHSKLPCKTHDHS